MKKVLLALLILTVATPAISADVVLSWNASAPATGYKLYQSVDQGATWDAGTDVGNVTNHLILNVPDSGLVLFRVGAYNTFGESIRTWSGAWYNGDWQLPASVGGTGIE